MKIINGWIDEALDGGYGAKSSSRAGRVPKYLVLHGTAGGSSAVNIDSFFTSGLDADGQPVQASAHVIIDQAGTIIQGISLDQAAWANCCTSADHAPYFADGEGHNLETISIEHVKSSTDNSDELTPIQQQRSFEVVQCICDAYGIPMQPGDAQGGIVSHADLDPVNRERCPGAYPWDKLWAFLNNDGGIMIPTNWKDDGKVLTAPNGHRVILFRDHVLAGNWDPNNQPLEEEQSVATVEDYYQQTPSAGTRQLFNYGELATTAARGIYMVGIGHELLGCRADRDQAKAALKLAQTQIAALQAQVAILNDSNPLHAKLMTLKAAFEDVVSSL